MAIEADTNKQNSTPRAKWDAASIDRADAPRTVRTYLDTLDEAAFGAVSEVYRALKEVCQARPSKTKCCPERDARKISREEHEDARKVACDIAKTKQYTISMHQHKKVKMLFAYRKRILGLGRLRLSGPCSANYEFLLAATAQNLRRLAKIFLAPQQTAKA